MNYFYFCVRQYVTVSTTNIRNLSGFKECDLLARICLLDNASPKPEDYRDFNQKDIVKLMSVNYRVGTKDLKGSTCSINMAFDS